MTRQLLACAASEHRVETINGLRLHFLQSGASDGATVCFLHGGAAHAHWFDRVLGGVRSSGFQAISLDQRGHGESQWATPPAYATENFANDLRALMDRLGWRRMTLVGHHWPFLPRRWPPGLSRRHLAASDSSRIRHAHP